MSMTNTLHPSVNQVLRKLRQAEYWLELEAQTSEPLERTLNFPTVIADLRGAARYVMATEGNATAAALLMMTAIHIKQVKESTGNPGFPAELVNEISLLINEPDQTPPGKAKTEDSEHAHFGLCPECGNEGAYMNIGPEHIFICDECHTSWSVGANLFDSWRDEDETVWAANKEKLEGYRKVKPVYYRKDAAHTAPDDDDFIF
jgi:hypothetical protein